MAQTIQPLALNVRLSCQLLDVPESSYYERINRHPSKTQLRRQYLSLKISQLFNANRGIYGAPKIHHLLLKQGEKVGLKLVQKLMKQLQLKSVVIKKFNPGYSLSDHINRKNLIQTEPTKKNKVWSTDITYIPTHEGWLYLAVVIDLFSRLVVGWSMKSRITTDLVLDALLMALWRRNPKNKVLIHSDQASQYTSHEWQTFLKHHNLESSMSRRLAQYTAHAMIMLLPRVSFSC